MVSVLRNPTSGPRIVPFGVTRTSRDVLANGRPAFRVTQRYADIDKYFGGIHAALDIGNYNCGDIMLAAHAGTVSNKRDIYGALIVEVRASDGSVTGYGHLSGYAKAHGAYVAARTVIGYVGSTGLGAICHCHFYHIDANGRKRDPWPMLEQNQIAIPDTSTIPVVGYLRFNAGVNGVNVRTTANANVDNIYAIAWSDGDPRPNGIVTTARYGGKWVGSTSARRSQYGAPVRGADGRTYYRLRIHGTNRYTYVNTAFMHRA